MAKASQERCNWKFYCVKVWNTLMKIDITNVDIVTSQ